MSSLVVELRQALRSLARAPSFAVMVTLTLALGIGANVAIFSVVDAVLVRPLALDREGRLVQVFNRWGDGVDRGQLSVPLYHDVLERTDVFARFALYYDWRGVNLVAGEGEPEYVDALSTTASLFDVLGVRPALGRGFEAVHDTDGGERVVVLSHQLWLRRFGGAESVIGSLVRLEEEEPYTVIGVLPPGVDFPSAEIGLWLPVRFDPEERSNRGNHSYNGIGRLRDGESAAAAERAIAELGRRVRADHPEDYPERWGMMAVPWQEVRVGRYRVALSVLLAVVAVVLLVACGNVANLFLARGASRRRELAIRSALGAGKLAVVRRLVVESAILAGAGAVLGCGLAWALLRGIRAVLPASVPGIERAAIDLRVLGFAAVVTALTVLLFSLAPVSMLVRRDLVGALRARGGVTGGRRLRGLLVAGQVALATAVVLASGLLVRSLLEQQRIDLGFDAERVVTARLMPRRDAYWGKPDALRSLATRLVASLEARPEIARAALVNNPPLGRFNMDRWIWIEGHEPLEEGDRLTALFRVVTPGYFDVIGLRAVSGRVFTESDDHEAPGAVVVSASMAREFWGDEDAIGRRLKLGIGPDSESSWLTVVGVVGDVRERLLEPGRSTFYVPFAQQPFPLLNVVARAAEGVEGDPLQIGSLISRSVLAIDPEQPVFGLTTLRAAVVSAGGASRFNAIAVGAFSVLALVLAAVGTYGVVAASVGERRRALAIGVTLGASPGDIVKLAFGRELLLVAGGVVAGLVGALAAGRLLGSSVLGQVLYQVETSDPAAVVGAGAVLLAVAAAACWGPARRAQGVQPIEVLRQD
ncbi:MAG TPA: ABC transporter permease [Thermoanaerobaculia bacterium]|nr:ABC transporter permease [Thermoanaerobaculia bacterium]